MPDDDSDLRAGWKRDPSRRFAGRYWDGERWTEHVVSAGHVVSVDEIGEVDPVPLRPPVAAPPAPTTPLVTSPPATAPPTTSPSQGPPSTSPENNMMTTTAFSVVDAGQPSPPDPGISLPSHRSLTGSVPTIRS